MIKNKDLDEIQKLAKEIPITPRRVVTFKPGQKLKSRVETYAAGSGTQDEVSSLPYPANAILLSVKVSELCGVKSHVLRYWEQEFSQLKPVRRGNRRYYRHQDVVLIRQIRTLLYDKRFTIDGARSQLKGSPKKATNESYKQLLRETIAELENIRKSLEGEGGVICVSLLSQLKSSLLVRAFQLDESL